MQYRRNGYYDDIEARFILPKALIAVVCTVLLILFIFLFNCADHNENISENETYNQYANAYNELSVEERTVVRPFMSYEDKIDEETGLLPLADCSKVYIRDYIFRYRHIIIGILLIVYSVAIFVMYIKQKSNYYFADLPLKNPYCLFLLLSMFLFWPLFIYGRIRMYLQSRSVMSAEKQAIYDQARQALLEEAKPKIGETENARAEKAYINYILRGREKARASQINDVDERLEQTNRNLQYSANEVREYQQQKSALLAEKKRLENSFEPTEQYSERARKEWGAIREMRGVTGLYVEKKGKQQCLVIKVCVRVPYDGELYDFGDYKIKLYPDSYKCERTRSGVRLDATSKRPDYNEPSGFCFGNRHSLINKYVRNARYLEALTLMIDSLHSVNGEGVEREIPYCFRKVRKFERAKRRLRRKLVNNLA